MEDKGSEGIQPSITAATLFALLTLLGGILAVPHFLSSARPESPVRGADAAISEQMVNTRLWEDPFAALDRLGTSSLQSNTGSVMQVKFSTNSPLVLAVMVPGGPSSENREDRIRCRYAIVSALAESSYAPDDPGHIGIAETRWDSKWQQQQQGTNYGTRQLRYAFESYSHEKLGTNQLVCSTPEVLVVWLNEDMFEDDFRKRFDLFAANCLSSAWRIAIIGPRNSSTLHNLFAHSKNTNSSDDTKHTNRPGLFMAVPRAIDEALVPGALNDTEDSRYLVKSVLSNNFAPVYNFAATDADLANAAIDELKRRGIDFANPNNHLVLVANRDSFSGRMIVPAFAARLDGRSRAEFFKKYCVDDCSIPANLHPFFYFSGLDGSSLSDGANNSQPDSEKKSRQSSTDPEQKRRFGGGYNRAEGATQLDYLNRLAAEISDLERSLGRSQGVRAIGIAGGDIYDTLLILQALRPKFPNAQFFTTDLDARYWDPSCWRWTRNLLVVSSYGTRLHDTFQGHTLPFRDSVQTAEYVAALAALGNTNLTNVSIAVRRFEIGRTGPVDMSPIDQSRPNPAQRLSTNSSVHPKPPQATSLAAWVWKDQKLIWIAVVASCGLFLSYLFFIDDARKMFLKRKVIAEPLWINEADLGGTAGVGKLIEFIKQDSPPKTLQEQWQWLHNQLEAKNGKWICSQPGNPNPEQRAHFRDTLHHFIDLWNEFILNFPHEKLSWPPNVATDRDLDRILENRKSANDLIELAFGNAPPEKKQPKSDPIPNIHQPDPPPLEGEEFTFPQASRAAHKASQRLYELESARIATMWILTGVSLLFACILLSKNLADPTYSAFFSGTSAWPTIWLCFLSSVLTAFFLAISCFGLRTTLVKMTLENRLYYSRPTNHHFLPWRFLARMKEHWQALAFPPLRHIPNQVLANKTWTEYFRKGRVACRVSRTLFMTLVYVFLIFGLMTLFHGWNLPFLTHSARTPYHITSTFAAIAVYFLSFWTVDAALMCRSFIKSISQGSTLYPEATQQHFARICGLDIAKSNGIKPKRSGSAERQILADWIDVRIIAEIAQHIGRLIYFPAISLSVLILAYSKYFYNWPWTISWYVATACTLFVAAAGMLILQQGAKKALAESAQKLEQTLNQLQATGPAASTGVKKLHSIDRAKQLLVEVRSQKIGGFWTNPVFRALLLPGGTTLIAFLQSLFGG